MLEDDSRIVLRNGAMQVVLLPGSGGRIESLRGDGVEFLLQPSSGFESAEASGEQISGMRFQDGACSRDGRVSAYGC